MEAYCRSKVEEGRCRFPCPDSNCQEMWDFFLVRHVACLDGATRRQIEKNVTENYISQGLGYHQCPGCMTWCIPFNAGDICLRCPACSETRGTPYDFCWACQREWIGTDPRCCGNRGCDGKDPRIKILHIAEKIIIDKIPACPSIRACPKCGLLINHTGGCRHMTCTGCGAEFCFICLRKWNNTYDVAFPGHLSDRACSRSALRSFVG